MHRCAAACAAAAGDACCAQAHTCHPLLVVHAAMPLPAKEVKPPAWPAVSGRPNFIYLLLDDLGYDDVGLHHPPGSAVRTPNIDRLLREGTEFTNFYTTPMCTMSRCGGGGSSACGHVNPSLR